MKYAFATELTPRQRNTFGTRLLKLADLIKSLKPSQYYHGAFVRSCGTVGCALGHAAVNSKKMFKGLKASWSADEGIVFENWAYASEAADEFFGPRSYSTIFDEDAFSNNTVSRNQVVARILKVAREVYGVCH